MAALFLAAFFFVLIILFRVDLLPVMPKQNAAVILTGKVNKIEDKEKQVLLFLSHAKGEESGTVSSYGHVILSISAEQFSDAKIRIGNRIQADSTYMGFGKARNAGNFDEENYYRSMGISGKFRLQKKGKIEIIDASYDAGRQWLFEIRRKIRGIFQSILERDTEKAGIFSAIVLGDRSQVESDVKSLYQKNGIAHILAVSGLHISLIGMGLFKILRKQFYVPVSALLS
ncbi:MAG: ComEC/Rec2 family competence protein, partial [Parasporobacterium sp.]|nr:ComEC/Rec2 family competence protein [Parasporobacterium sp.]